MKNTGVGQCAINVIRLHKTSTVLHSKRARIGQRAIHQNVLIGRNCKTAARSYIQSIAQGDVVRWSDICSATDPQIVDGPVAGVRLGAVEHVEKTCTIDGTVIDNIPVSMHNGTARYGKCTATFDVKLRIGIDAKPKRENCGKVSVSHGDER